MDPRIIKQNASASLAAASYDPKKLALLHTGVVVLFSLIISLLSYLLELGMDSAGGLSGIALRSLLESAQVILSMAGAFLLPFWQVGFLYAAIRYNRRESVSTGTLLEGFRRLGPVFRLNVLLLLVVMGVMMVSSYIGTMIFLFSPFADGMYDALNTILETTDATAFTYDMLMELMPHMVWLFVLNGIVMLLIGLPMYYRYRMSEFALMNGAKGALAAMRESTQITRRRRMALFRFDLSFWWFYGAQLLIAAIAYADTILAALGVALPVSGNVLYWILFALHAAVTLIFSRQYGAYYQTAYAHYYDLLRNDAPPVPNSTVQNQTPKELP